MNKELYNKRFKVPQEILNFITQNLNNLNGKFVKGVERAKTLTQEKTVTYQQLKLIVHEIQNIDKERDSIKYGLMGGDLMSKWGLDFLNSQRILLKNNKQITKSNSEIGGVDGVRKNAFNKTHKKKDNYKIPTNIMKSNSEKSSVSSLTSSLKLFEEINKIKKLM